MLPGFLVIGAMKAGSTTLYADLDDQAGVFVPRKELSGLHEPDVTDERGRARYEAAFADAGPSQVIGEVSERYAKLPDESPEIVDRAAAVLGAEFRVVYIVRDPVDRTVSQHYHELSKRTIREPSVDAAVRSVPRLIDYSRYAFQLRPWVDLVGTDRVHLVRFEDYCDDRSGGLAGVLDFLGAGPLTSSASLEKVYNVGDSKTVTTGVGRTIKKSALYRRHIRPRLPGAVRTRGRDAMMHGVPPRPQPPSVETVDRIIDQVGPDLDTLGTLGLDLPALWDLDATRRRYARMHADA